MVTTDEFTETELNDARNSIEAFRRMAREWEEAPGHNREMVKHCLNEAKELARFYGLEETI